eukprot:3102193-Pleurochrysis_carterae.AAC.1
MSARKSRTRAAVGAAELEEANAVDAVAWPAGLTADGQTGLLLFSLQRGPSRDCCGTGSHLSAKLVVQMP